MLYKVIYAPLCKFISLTHLCIYLLIELLDLHRGIPTANCRKTSQCQSPWTVDRNTGLWTMDGYLKLYGPWNIKFCGPWNILTLNS